MPGEGRGVGETTGPLLSFKHRAPRGAWPRAQRVSGGGTRHGRQGESGAVGVGLVSSAAGPVGPPRPDRPWQARRHAAGLGRFCGWRAALVAAETVGLRGELRTEMRGCEGWLLSLLFGS